MDSAFDYAKDYQMVTEESYPYEAVRNDCTVDIAKYG